MALRWFCHLLLDSGGFDTRIGLIIWVYERGELPLDVHRYVRCSSERHSHSHLSNFLLYELVDIKSSTDNRSKLLTVSYLRSVLGVLGGRAFTLPDKIW